MGALETCVQPGDGEPFSVWREAPEPAVVLVQTFPSVDQQMVAHSAGVRQMLSTRRTTLLGDRMVGQELFPLPYIFIVYVCELNPVAHWGVAGRDAARGARHHAIQPEFHPQLRPNLKGKHRLDVAATRANGAGGCTKWGKHSILCGCKSSWTVTLHRVCRRRPACCDAEESSLVSNGRLHSCTERFPNCVADQKCKGKLPSAEN